MNTANDIDKNLLTQYLQILICYTLIFMDFMN